MTVRRPITTPDPQSVADSHTTDFARHVGMPEPWLLICPVRAGDLPSEPHPRPRAPGRPGGPRDAPLPHVIAGVSATGSPMSDATSTTAAFALIHSVRERRRGPGRRQEGPGPVPSHRREQEVVDEPHAMGCSGATYQAR